MKRKILFSVFLLLSFVYFADAQSQWVINGADMYNYNTGNVGIGTSSPATKLTIDAGNNVGNGLTVQGTNGPIINLTTGSFSLQAGLATQVQYYSNIAQQGDAVLRITGPASGTSGSLIMGVQNAIGDLKFTTYNGGNTDNLQMIIKQDGKVGIGTSSPLAKLDVSGGIRSTSTVVFGSGVLANFTNASDQDINFTISSPGVADKYALIAPSTSTNLAFGIGAIEKMRINSAGNLLIGQSSQVNTSYKLDVAGSVRANEIIVNTSGADFVFDKNYQLNTLSKTAVYINQHRHLPQIESAAEMKKDGVNLGEFNIKLLQKIEELTLYLIEKDKQVSRQSKQIEGLKGEVDELKTQVKQLLNLYNKKQ